MGRESVSATLARHDQRIGVLERFANEVLWYLRGILATVVAGVILMGLEHFGRRG